MIAILKKYRVYHLLGADDEGRISYNLNRLQSDSLYALRAYIYDSIYYHKTDIRIERMECFPLDFIKLSKIKIRLRFFLMNGQ